LTAAGDRVRCKDASNLVANLGRGGSGGSAKGNASFTFSALTAHVCTHIILLQLLSRLADGKVCLRKRPDLSYRVVLLHAGQTKTVRIGPAYDESIFQLAKKKKR
jgi:hypothetical protein